MIDKEHSSSSSCITTGQFDAGYCDYCLNEESLLNSLQNMGYIINESKGSATVTMLSGDLFIEAANEIKTLIHLGNSLVDVLKSGSDIGWDNAIDTWQKHIEEMYHDPK